MEGYEYIIILLLIVSIFFFFLGYSNKREGDDGTASVYYSIGIVLLILAFVAFLIFINVFKLIPTKEGRL